MAGVLDKVFGRKVDGQMKSAEDQTPEEKKLAAFVRQKVEEVRSTAARVAHEANWMTNTAYLLGYDQVYYDSNSKSFRNMNGAKPLSKTRVHVNTILPTIQNRLARLCKNPPRYEVRPNSPKAEDKDSARLSQQVLVQLWEKLKLNKKRIGLYMWMQQCGYSFMKIGWDDCEGQRITSPLTGEIDYEGEVKAEVASAFEIFVDPLCKEEFEDAEWVVHARVRKLEYFRTRYPERGYLVKEEDAWLLSIQYEQRINSLTPQAPFSGSQATQMKDAAIELAYYEKPSRKNINGRYVVIASGVVLDDKELPIDELPFSKFDDILIAGKFESESIITHLRPLNDQFNKIVSKRSDFFNKMMAGKYLSPRGAKLQQEALNDDSGEVVEYDARPNQPVPQAMTPPQMPGYVYKETEEFKLMHYDISGIGEISRGTLPSAGIPAIGMQYLQEQDETRLGIETELHEHAWARVGRHILKYVNKYYKTERLLKLSGENQDYVIKHFKGEDLKGHYDVIVARGSTLPGSKVLRRQEILNTLDRGILGNPQDPKVLHKVYQTLEFGDVGDLWEDYSLDMKQVRQKLAEVERGIPPDHSEFDNHEIIILEFNRYRKTDKFERLSPAKKALFMGVMEWHVQALMRIGDPNIAVEDNMRQEAEMVQSQMMNNPDSYFSALASQDEVAQEELINQEMAAKEAALMEQEQI